jgi:hypothetical protein
MHYCAVHTFVKTDPFIMCDCMYRGSCKRERERAVFEKEQANMNCEVEMRPLVVMGGGLVSLYVI